VGKTKISHEEWMLELERVVRASADMGMSTIEIAEAMGRSDKFVQEFLKKLQRKGTLGFGRRPSVSVDGKRCFTPVYWITKAKEGKRG
jgi:Mn-dependent DtxR family transcriptional regulator